MGNYKAFKILVVDDSNLYRQILCDILSDIPNAEVVGTAENGKIALDKVDILKPDLITLDVDMPVMDGLETLKQLKSKIPQLHVIMVSSLTISGAETTIQALELGAFDFVTKPFDVDIQESRKNLNRQLVPKINVLITKQAIGSIQNIKKTESELLNNNVIRSSIPETNESKICKLKICEPIKIVVIGISTGGPNALKVVIPKLPKNLDVPVLIVQHMPETFTTSLADFLNNKSKITVQEAKTGQIIEPGKVYIAPGGKQMKIRRANEDNAFLISITDDPPENYCQPSVDYLFRSVAKYYGNHALGIIMTGMGQDGLLGSKLMKRKGSIIIAQDEASCVVFGMPKQAIDAGIVDAVLPLEQIAEQIIYCVKTETTEKKQ